MTQCELSVNITRVYVPSTCGQTFTNGITSDSALLRLTFGSIILLLSLPYLNII